MILWLDDRPDELRKILRGLKDKGILNRQHYIILTSVVDFDEYLKEYKDDPVFRPTVFVLDILLPGTPDLRSIGIRDADATAGYLAGFVLADRLLRTADSRWRDTPILFYTSREKVSRVGRDLTLNSLVGNLARQGAASYLFQKGDDDDSFIEKVGEVMANDQ